MACYHYECDDCEDTGTCYDCGGFGCRECDYTGDCPWCSVFFASP